MLRKTVGLIIELFGILLILPPMVIFCNVSYGFLTGAIGKIALPDSLEIQGINHHFVGWEIIAVCGGFFSVGILVIWFGWIVMMSQHNDNP